MQKSYLGSNLKSSLKPGLSEILFFFAILRRGIYFNYLRIGLLDGEKIMC